MKIIISFVFLVVLVLLLPVQKTVYSHGEEGKIYEEEKDGYIINIGYSEESPVAIEPVRFDLLAYPKNSEQTEEVIFTDVWVRVAELGNQRNLFFSGGINKPVFAKTGFRYAFPKEGAYEIFVRFQKDGESVVETSFQIDVTSSLEEDNSGILNTYLLMSGAGGLTLGILLMLFISRKKHTT